MNISALCISPSNTIHDAISCIEKNVKGIALVINEDRKLLGTITDGDIRRGILRGVALSASASEIMQPKPVTAPSSFTHNELLVVMNELSIRHIPIVNEKNILLDLVSLNDLTKEQFIPTKAIIMAGGEGQRLRPLTNETPKPMLKVWGKPILEVIIEHLREFGIRDFYITTRYKSEKIKEYFKDGAHLKLNINYIEEEEKLGTLGAVSLIKENFEHPFIVINSDILTKLNFRDMYHFHMESKAEITVAVRKYDLQIPFGTVEIEGDSVVKFSEKPQLEFFVNAGVYILNPRLKDMIEYNKQMDVPDLINKLIAQNRRVSSFPIREYWLDVGRFTDFEKAHIDILNGNY